MLQNVIVKFEDQIKRDTLSVEVVYNTKREYNAVKINGEDLELDLEKV